MERHKCKLCSRSFSNGRALGGHMKAHLATLPLPPKTQQLGGHTLSASSSSSSSGDDEQQQQQQQQGKDREVEEKSLAYGLRENPKKSLRFADPEFSFAVDSGSVVQDRESETESRNPTRRRSKRNRKPVAAGNDPKQNSEMKKPKLNKPSWVDSSSAEPEPVSSVSDTSPEEDVAMCLMMLSRDVWKRNNEELDDQLEVKQVERSVEVLEEESKEIKFSSGKHHRCEKCKKLFRSYHALSGHRRICSGAETGNAGNNGKIFECPFCGRMFGSGQALGGHKRSHLLGSSSSSNAAKRAKFNNSLIDLNLPAPLEEDEFSVVSDA